MAEEIANRSGLFSEGKERIWLSRKMSVDTKRRASSTGRRIYKAVRDLECHFCPRIVKELTYFVRKAAFNQHHICCETCAGEDLQPPAGAEHVHNWTKLTSRIKRCESCPAEHKS